MSEQVILNNVDRLLVDDLRATIRPGSKLSLVASTFSIYAYQALREELEGIEELRFVFSAPTFVAEQTEQARREFYIPRLSREQGLTGTEYEIRLRNELTQRAVARECADWIRRKVRFKSSKRHEGMMGFGLVDEVSYLPLRAFTTTELGLERGDSPYTIIGRSYPTSGDILRCFESLWSDRDLVEEVTEEVLATIATAYQENSPERLYFFTLFHLFREFLEGISEDVLPNEATGFRESAVWQKLYRFQQDACLGIIGKLEKYNGCILADSVGLGKTFTAISVIKYYELRNKSVLVLCPKKLYQNWNTYRGNYKNNPLAADQLRYDVLYHTDLGRRRGSSNGVDLGRINWGNYDLVVIDESHNFRNGGKISTDAEEASPRRNRYLHLLEEVIRSGVKTKVLMLSATPVNNGFRDLKNQLQLAYQGDVQAFDKLLATDRSLEEIFRQAQTEYNRWCSLPEAERTTESLLSKLSGDFFEVLDSVTIARSRRHIEQYYDTAEIGSFPQRLPVISRRPQLALDPLLIGYEAIYEQLRELNLAVYTPSDFLLPSRRWRYFSDEDKRKGLSLAGRELGIRHLMCTNILKRLESSVDSFRQTLVHLLVLLQDRLGKIDKLAEKHQQGADDFTSVDTTVWESDLDLDDQSDELLLGGKKTSVDLRDMDYLSWRKYLLQDFEILTRLLQETKYITPAVDAKLQQLLEDIEQKVKHPINAGNKKIIIFTAFADTAHYLYDELSATLLERYGLHSVLITGTDSPRSTLSGTRQPDFDKALSLFSPLSKDKATLYPDSTESIDILIATDCISEGQNLQDCDYLINYDIHWNPVRLIQRFGRIDRIGSRNASIQMVNYWPDLQLDDYINLKARVENRMKISILTATGDDNLLSAEEQGDLDYRRRQLERLQTEVVDLEEIETGISILDLGLGEFRLDLLDYVQRQSGLEQTPEGIHALLPATPTMPPGVIFVLRNRTDAVNIDRKNLLHPFYLVYITRTGQVTVDHLQPKKILDKLRGACRGRREPYDELCRDFNLETKDGRQMDTYAQLLGQTIQSIISVKEQRAITSFLEGASGELFSQQMPGLDDFELLCFFVVR